MGSDAPSAYPEDGEGPARRTVVAAFEIGATAVTVAEFAAFVAATGHVTDAERFGDSLVFTGMLAPDDVSPAVAATPWWRVVAGAAWTRPAGPGGPGASDDHPVTHVSALDAAAYAQWAGGRLPTETEWEYAARGGLAGMDYPWGHERDPGGCPAMNIFRGVFPGRNTATDGYAFTAPAASFEPNGFGLFNTTGNVWELTSGAWPDSRVAIRGGSFLCHESYCRRYRVSARSGVSADTSSAHIGFRIAASGRRLPIGAA